MPASRRPSRASRALAGSVLAALALLAGACAGRAPASSSAAPADAAAGRPPEPARPLASLAGQKAILLPVQQVDGEGAGLVAPRRLDDDLAFALGERGLGGRWTTAAEARRMAGNNPSLSLTPETLPLPAAKRLGAGSQVQEPLAGQLRALAALADTRYAIVPLTLQLEPAAAGSEVGAARVVLRLILVDVRGAQILWAGETSPVTVAPGSPALTARVAERFADLVVAPREP